MFQNLFGRKDEEKNESHLFRDRTYMTSDAKLKACADLAKKDERFVFIAWFSDTAKKFRDFFAQHGINENRITEAGKLHASQLIAHTPVFVEHYPLHSKEEALVQNWEHKDVLVYSALDEPLFRHFGSEKVIPMMKIMGMKESEAIDHPMVTKSILSGQQKLAGQVIIEQPAASQSEWMLRNIRKT